MMHTKKLSLIILTYNSEQHIYDCLESVYKFNDIGDELEIIVVDNNSRQVDAMFTKIRELYHEEITLIKNTANSGYGEGNNIGIRASHAPYIMIMNPDIRLVMPVFKKVLDTFAKEKCCMIGMKQWFGKNQKGLSFDVDGYRLPTVLAFLLAVLANRFSFYWQKYMYINGACFFIKKSLFEEIGMFDKNIFLYCEELDIYRRIRQNSPQNKILFLRDCDYLHLAGDRSLSATSFQRQLDSEKYCAEKYHIPISALKKRKLSILNIYILLNYLRGKKENVETLQKVKQQIRTLL